MEVTKELREWATYSLGDEDLYNDCMYLADEIDESFYKHFDNANLPLDMYDEPCNLDDVVLYKGKKYLVVAISHKGGLCIRDFNSRTRGGGFWIKSNEVTHGNDSQDKLYKDVEKLSKYCMQMKFPDENCIEAAIKQLLYRQHVLDDNKNSHQ